MRIAKGMLLILQCKQLVGKFDLKVKTQKYSIFKHRAFANACTKLFETLITYKTYTTF